MENWMLDVFLIIGASALSAFTISELLTYRCKCKSPLQAEVMAEEAMNAVERAELKAEKDRKLMLQLIEANGRTLQILQNEIASLRDEKNDR